ncbi:hypothetical protein [Caldimonas brevitalea]|uniref:Uncharacterized protein n=1 Tax=Caldimonas brevitalea TaxID=413882 RepID=A0A0G3BR45_9BURK|nr:hypothetical protein [Caldimonas brevitalea]AKJ29821.1 hypothetical protein AAW51_3130 [Caldimonas brevitalea]
MTNWAVGAKVLGLVAVVLTVMGTALGVDAAGEALLVLVSLPVAGAVAFGVSAFLDLDR